MADAQMTAARGQIEALMREREAYARVVALLVKIIKSGAEHAVVDGQIALPLDEFEAVPGLWTVRLAPAEVQEEGADDAPVLRMVVVVVEPKGGGENGRLVVPGRPGIVRP